MDIYCSVCGEPWDFDSMHEEAQERYGISYQIASSIGTAYGSLSYERTLNPKYNADDYQKVYKQVSSEFRSIGCKALKSFGPMRSCKPREVEENSLERDRTFNLTRSEAAGALYDILGDDMDGAAAMLEDMGF